MKVNRFCKYVNSPVGLLKIETDEKQLLSISFVSSPENDSDFQPEILDETARQLEEYFKGRRKKFDLKLAPEGTLFQQKVWQQIIKVEYGETATYQKVAQQVGTEKHTRAVGLANGQNPIPIIVPCHRIIGANGKLTGYAGGIDRKKWLLQHEMKFSTAKGKLF